MAAPQQRNPMTRRAAIALWLLLAASLLCGCARSTDPPRTQPAAAPIAVEAEHQPLSAADEAAQAAERHADAVERAANGGKEPGPIPPKPPAAGPILTLEMLQTRMMTLAIGVRSAQDTEATHVAKVVGVPLQPWKSDWFVERGRLREGGGYSIEVGPLYRDAPGKFVTIGFGMDDWETDPRLGTSASASCMLRLEPLRDQLTKAGFVASQGAPWNKLFWIFSRDDGSNGIRTFVKLESYLEHPASVHECVSGMTIDVSRNEE